MARKRKTVEAATQPVWDGTGVPPAVRSTRTSTTASTENTEADVVSSGTTTEQGENEE